MDINGWHTCILAIHTANIAMIGSMCDNKNHQKPKLIELMQPFRTPPRKGPEPKNMDSMNHATKQNLLKAFTTLSDSLDELGKLLLIPLSTYFRKICSHQRNSLMACDSMMLERSQPSNKHLPTNKNKACKKIIKTDHHTGAPSVQHSNPGVRVSLFFLCHRVISWRLRPVRG